jgi:hypothetical protein
LLRIAGIKYAGRELESPKLLWTVSRVQSGRRLDGLGLETIRGKVATNPPDGVISARVYDKGQLESWTG